MRILTSFEALCLDKEEYLAALANGALPDDMVAEIKTGLESAFRDEATDDESYLCLDWLSSKDIVWGASDKDALLSTVRGWVPDIQAHFLKTVERVYRPGMAARDVVVDNDKTYMLQRAARMLDNSWWSYADYGAYISNEQGFAYFRVFPDESQMARIEAHPEEYFVLEGYVKA
ncbi:hypothetical protein [uncultured Flavonifractor sp.]|uniref:hypothetical protein n=1 Tax=uncultured Flavonifractor sp. TaxID=1193534 RepID=UPI002599C249|nr:hypothetical protein [uncultured Flavonifractor sp.]